MTEKQYLGRKTYVHSVDREIRIEQYRPDTLDRVSGSEKDEVHLDILTLISLMRYIRKEDPALRMVLQKELTP